MRGKCIKLNFTVNISISAIQCILSPLSLSLSLPTKILKLTHILHFATVGEERLKSAWKYFILNKIHSLLTGHFTSIDHMPFSILGEDKLGHYNPNCVFPFRYYQSFFMLKTTRCHIFFFSNLASYYFGYKI